MCRRKSPSVMIPASLPSSSTTPRQPRAFSVITTMASAIGTSPAVSGRRSPLCIKSPTNFSLAPSCPPGCRTWKSRAVKPLLSSSAMARQSPSASCIDGRGGRRKPVRAGFLALGKRQHHFRRLGQRAVRVRGHRDQRHGEPARIGDEVAELDRLARPGEGEDHVVAGDHAEIAVARLARMHEGGRRAGGRERACHLHADMAALAHAGDDHPAAAGADEANSFGEAVDELRVERRFERAQALGFELNGARGRGDRFARVVYRKTVTFEADGHVPRSPAFPVALYLPHSGHEWGRKTLRRFGPGPGPTLFPRSASDQRRKVLGILAFPCHREQGSKPLRPLSPSCPTTPARRRRAKRRLGVAILAGNSEPPVKPDPSSQERRHTSPQGGGMEFVAAP